MKSHIHHGGPNAGSSTEGGPSGNGDGDGDEDGVDKGDSPDDNDVVVDSTMFVSVVVVLKVVD